MADQEETMRIVAEIVDKFSKPMRDLRDDLKKFDVTPGQRRLNDHFWEIRNRAQDFKYELKSGLTPALAAFGVTTLSVGGALGTVAATMRGFSQSTRELVYMRRETGLAIDYMRAFEALGRRIGSTPEAMAAGLSAFARNMKALRAGTGATYNLLQTEGNEEVKKFSFSLRQVASNEEALKRVLKFIDQIPDATNRLRYLEAFGLPGQLGRLTGRERQQALREIAKTLGTTSKEAQDAAMRFARAMDELGDEWEAFQIQLGSSGALDSVRELLKEFRTFVHEDKDNIVASINGLAGAFGELGKGLRLTLDGWAHIAKIWKEFSEFGPPPAPALPNTGRPPAFNELRNFQDMKDWLGSFFGSEDQKKKVREGTSEGIQEGLRKMMFERPAGGGGVAQVLRASYSPGGGGGGSIAAPMGSLGTRGDRNNNPGNIKYGSFAKSMGATGQDADGYAIFPSASAGRNAMSTLLQQKYQGLTINQLGTKWADHPPPSYLRGLQGATGLRGDQIPDLNDPAMRSRVMEGIMRGEGTGRGVRDALRDLSDGGGAVPSDILAQARKV
ncbi:MAG TPA: hypothetical protein VHD14_00575, partial [Pseudolabrys sp.]|nr:hypothetical protein [Pseudolabrys sp.]